MLGLRQHKLMDVEIEIAESARKRGIPDEDILHALRNAIEEFDQEDGLTMAIGPAHSGALLEVGYLIADDGCLVILHSMPARPKFLR